MFNTDDIPKTKMRRASGARKLGDESDAQAVSYQCLLAAQTVIQGLGLAGVQSENVVVRKLPIDRALGADQPTTLPAILLTPERETMDPRAGLTGLDDVVYGVLVTMVDADNQEATLALNLDRYTLWREQIARAFRNQRLAAVSAVINAYVEPADPVTPAAWQNNLFVGALSLRFVSREPRGDS